MEQESADNNERFIVWAETAKHPKPLIQIDLSFPRLIDDIVVPYQTDQPFFIDGAPVKRVDLLRIKLLKADRGFHNEWILFNRHLKHAETALRKVLGEQYHLRVEAIIRERSADVTSQIIKAYDQAIRPSLKEYIPKREELIKMASTVFVESMKLLGGS